MAINFSLLHRHIAIIINQIRCSKSIKLITIYNVGDVVSVKYCQFRELRSQLKVFYGFGDRTRARARVNVPSKFVMNNSGLSNIYYACSAYKTHTHYLTIEI